MTAAAPVRKLEGMPRKPPKLMGGLPGGDQGLLMTLISLLKSKAAAGSAQLVPYATWIWRHPRKSKSQAGDRTCKPDRERVVRPPSFPASREYFQSAFRLRCGDR